MTSGPKTGMNAILIGEAVDILTRINQYKKGTQPCGNKYWRDEMLNRGDMRYWVLKLSNLQIDGQPISADFSSNNFQLIIEQMFVFMELRKCDSSLWVVNRRQ